MSGRRRDILKLILCGLAVFILGILWTDDLPNGVDPWVYLFYTKTLVKDLDLHLLNQLAGHEDKVHVPFTFSPTGYIVFSQSPGISFLYLPFLLLREAFPSADNFIGLDKGKRINKEEKIDFFFLGFADFFFGFLGTVFLFFPLSNFLTGKRLFLL